MGVSGLFERAWRSETLADCPTFGEWLVMLPEEVPQPAGRVEVEPEAGAESSVGDAFRALMALARRFDEQKKLDCALTTYRESLALAPAGSGLAWDKRTVGQVGFSPDGGTLASGAGDGTVRLWGVRQ